MLMPKIFIFITFLFLKIVLYTSSQLPSIYLFLYFKKTCYFILNSDFLTVISWKCNINFLFLIMSFRNCLNFCFISLFHFSFSLYLSVSLSTLLTFFLHFQFFLLFMLFVSICHHLSLSTSLYLSFSHKTLTLKKSGTVFTTLHFLPNLQMGPISQIVTLHRAGKACKGKTLLFIGSVSELRRK